MDNALDVAGLRNVFIISFAIEFLIAALIYVAIEYNISKYILEEYQHKRLKIIGNANIAICISCFSGIIIMGYEFKILSKMPIVYFSITGMVTQYLFGFLLPGIFLWSRLKKY